MPDFHATRSRRSYLTPQWRWEGLAGKACQRAAPVGVAPRTLGASPQPTALIWDVPHVQQELALHAERQAAVAERIFHLVVESPDLGRPEPSPQPVVDVEDILGAVERGVPLVRPAAMHRLAAKAAARAAEMAAYPPSEAEIEDWARRLGEEAADLTD